MDTYIKTSSWAKEDQPKYKMLNKGLWALSDAEVLALIIKDSNQQNGLEIAKKILFVCDQNLDNLRKLTVYDLTKINGIGVAQATQIFAGFELARRRKNQEIFRETITKSEHSYEIFLTMCDGLDHEIFMMLSLNRANVITKFEVISQGGVTGTVVDPKIIFRRAVQNNAVSLVLGHNHTSGQCAPSEADIFLTRKLKNAGDILECPILDHVIIGDNKYFSFADDGRI
jgi:DNA repair protein RadC